MFSEKERGGRKGKAKDVLKGLGKRQEGKDKRCSQRKRKGAGREARECSQSKRKTCYQSNCHICRNLNI